MAILKIEGRHLPTVKMGDPNSLQLGETIQAIGFPSVVVEHLNLSDKTRFDATVTEGIVSGLKVNINEASVIQTTAPLTWGNSGGPAFNSRGEVIGIPTFISIHQGAGQPIPIQGFNFLVSANTAMEFVRDVGVNVQEESLFNRLWFEALELYSAGKFKQALTKLDEVLRVLPNQPDARKLQVEAQARVTSSLPISLMVIAASLLPVGIGLAVYLPQRGKKAVARPSQTVVKANTRARTPSLGTLIGQTGPDAGQSFVIGKSGLKIGRDPATNQIILDHPEVSREHAWVGDEGGSIVVRDLNSANGTYVNTMNVNCVQSTRLRDGDVVIIGKGNCASFIYQRGLER